MPLTSGPHDRNGGKPVVLAADAAARVRQVLADLTAILQAASQAGGALQKALELTALDNPEIGRPLAQIHYDACLAIDYIDFPMPVIPARTTP